MAIEQRHQCRSSQMETFASDSYRIQCQKCLLDRQIPSGVLNHSLILTEMVLCSYRGEKKHRKENFSAHSCPPAPGVLAEIT